MGHSPAVAARYYVQARPEIAERAATEATVGAGSTAGDITDTAGTKTGSITSRPEDRKSQQKGPLDPRKAEQTALADGSEGATEGPPEWAIQNSNL